MDIALVYSLIFMVPGFLLILASRHKSGLTMRVVTKLLRMSSLGLYSPHLSMRLARASLVGFGIGLFLFGVLALVYLGIQGR